MPIAPGDLFPRQTLIDLDGAARPLAEAWSAGDALIAVGHRDCKTTRQTLPYVERLHRQRSAGTVLAVLQDDAPAARALALEQDLSLPIRLDRDPYPFSAALRVAVVPTLFLVGRDGRVAAVCEAFRKAELLALAERFGAAPLFDAGDPMPDFKPG